MPNISNEDEHDEKSASDDPPQSEKDESRQPKPDKSAKRVYSFGEIDTGAHIARHTRLWYDEFSHVVVHSIKAGAGGSFSYYECVPVEQCSNVARVFFRDVALHDGYIAEFFSKPVYIIKKKSYTNSAEETLRMAADLLEKKEKYPCDSVYNVWKFYTSETFVIQCKSGKNRRKILGLKNMLANPLRNASRSDRYDLERDLGLREGSYALETMSCATAAGLKAGAKKPPSELVSSTAVKVVSRSKLGSKAITNAKSLFTRSSATTAGASAAEGSAAGTVENGAIAASSSSSAGATSARASMGATAATAAAIAIPMAAVEISVDVRSRWKNIEALVEDGLIENDENVEFYRKKYASMSVAGGSVNCGCIVAGAVVGSAIPIPVAGVAIGAVGGAVVGVVSGSVAKKVVGSTADRIHNHRKALTASQRANSLSGEIPENSGSKSESL